MVLGDVVVIDIIGNSIGWGKVWEDKGLCDILVNDELKIVIQLKFVVLQLCSVLFWQQKVYGELIMVSKDGWVYINKWWVVVEVVLGDNIVMDIMGNGIGWNKVWEDKGVC